jgi:hypothetical protein
MKFINPKIDFAFKKIFGSAESHEILDMTSILCIQQYKANEE